MSRELNSFEEVGWLADNGKHLATKVTTEAGVRVTRDHDAKLYKATIYVFSAATGETICTAERGFSTLGSLMDTLGIDDVDEVWEVLDV